MTDLKPKEKRCKACGKSFSPRSSTQKACRLECAIVVQNQTKEKKWNTETRRRRAAIKPKAKHAAEAQSAINWYVRERDYFEPCISCLRHHNGQYHAGHLRPRGAAGQHRFLLWNLNKQCKPCNLDLSGNILLYEKNLRLKIGDDKVDFLLSNNDCRAYDIEYLKRLKRIFNKKARIAVKRRQSNGY